MSEGQLAAIADDGEENKTQVFLLGHLAVASGVIIVPRRFPPSFFLWLTAKHQTAW